MPALLGTLNDARNPCRSACYSRRHLLLSVWGMSDTEEIPAGGIGGAAMRTGARRGRGIRRNLKAKLTCFSPVLSGGRIGAAQPQREIGQN